MKKIVVRESKTKSEHGQTKDAYRAPRLVTLGTTVRLVQGSSGYQRWDGGRGYYS
jgi:hypothetical protein